MMKTGNFTPCARPVVILAVLTVMAVADSRSPALSTPTGPEEHAPNATSAIAPTQAEAKGDVLMEERKYQAAIGEYERGPQNSAVLWNKIGVAYHHLFNLNAAKSHYEKALLLAPQYAAAMNNMGTAFYSEKKYGPAEKLYKKALKLSPRDATVYGNLGTLYFVRGNTRKGAEAYSAAFALDPHVFERSTAGGIGEGMSTQQRAMMNYSLAKTYANVGKNERAMQYLRMALSEGFSDRKSLLEGKEFATLRETPEFRQLISEKR